LNLVLVQSIREFIFAQDLEDLALQYVGLLELQVLSTFDFYFFLSEFDEAVRKFVSAPLHVHVEGDVVWHFGQILRGVYQLHSPVEGFEESGLDVRCLVQPLGADE